MAQRFDLKRLVQFETRVTVAEFDGKTNLWEVRTDKGDVVSTRFCIMATGSLSTAALPKVPGMDRFKGRSFHTGLWPAEPIDFTGQRVGVVGTGSSGIQLIPEVAKQARHLTVFQRTANYSMPARNAPMASEYAIEIKTNYNQLRQKARISPSGVAGFRVPEKSVFEVTPKEREKAFEERWQFGGIGFTRVFNDVLMNEKANHIAAEFVRGKIRELVPKPAVAELLTPTYLIGTKRLCADAEYFQTYNRDNVTLVDIRKAPITEITETGLRTQDSEYELDAIVFATGFDAITGSLLRIDIRTKEGVALRDLWAHGPRTYMGLMTAGIPNMFTITGPGSPSVLSNFFTSIEQHVDWIADCLAYLQDHSISRMEADPRAQDEWVAHVNEVANRSLFPRGNSWYVGANIPGKPRSFTIYIGGVGVYRQKCDEVAKAGYRGFMLSGERETERLA